MILILWLLWIVPPILILIGIILTRVFDASTTCSWGNVNRHANSFLDGLGYFLIIFVSLFYGVWLLTHLGMYLGEIGFWQMIGDFFGTEI